MKAIILISLLYFSLVNAQEKKTIIIASTNNFPPLNLLNKEHKLDGFAKDLSDSVFEHLNKKIERVHSHKWSKVRDFLLSKKADVIHDVGYTKERAKLFDFSLPIIEMDEVIFVRSEQVNVFNLESLVGKRVGCVNQHITHHFLQTIPGIKCSIVETPLEGVHALLSNRIDAYVYPKQIITYFMQSLDLSQKIKIVGKPIRRLSWSMGVRKEDKALLKDINNAILEIKTNGIYDEIYQKWFGEFLFKAPKDSLLSWPYLVSALIFLILASVAYHISKLRFHRLLSEELSKSNKLFKSVLDTIPSRVFWKDLNNNYLGCNELFRIDAGLKSANDIIGLNDFDLPWKDQAEVYRADDQNVMNTAIPKIKYEEPQTTPSGNKIWLQTSKIPLEDSSGQIYGVLGTYEEITERKLFEEELIKAKEEALASTIALNAFLTNMSHELRTPLNGIMGFAQIGELKARTENNEEYTEFFDKILHSSERLLVLLQDLLDYNKLKGNNLQLKITINKMINIIEPCIDEQRFHFEKRGITVDLSTEDYLPEVECDRIRIEQVFMNVLSNAVKFSPDNSEIKVSVKHLIKSNSLLVTVSDQGPGIDENDLKNIFKKFYQGKKGIENEGSGLGLTISRQIIHAHKGNISASNSIDGGASIAFEVPIFFKK